MKNCEALVLGPERSGNERGVGWSVKSSGKNKFLNYVRYAPQFAMESKWGSE